MKAEDVDIILKLWLEIAGRRLTQDQRDHLVAAYAICPLPLFLKLSFDEALRWHSYEPPELIRQRLQVSVYDTINALYERLEKAHGLMLVTNMLGCVTACE